MTGMARDFSMADDIECAPTGRPTTHDPYLISDLDVTSGRCHQEDACQEG